MAGNLLLFLLKNIIQPAENANFILGGVLPP